MFSHSDALQRQQNNTEHFHLIINTYRVLPSMADTVTQALLEAMKLSCWSEHSCGDGDSDTEENDGTPRIT